MCNTKNEEEHVYQTAKEIMNEGLVHDKIEEAKEYFKDIRKTGHNNYQNYNYLESHDIFPVVRKVCKELKLRTRFIWNNDNITLSITCQEDKSSEYFSIPVPQIRIEDPDKYMKAVGKTQTYAMRYLYIQAFEISVPDKVEQDNHKPQKQKKYTNGNKLSNASKAEPVTQTTLNTPKQNNTKSNIQDLARNIAEEMTEKGIETTVSNIREYTTQMFKEQRINNIELRELRVKLQAGELGL